MSRCSPNTPGFIRHRRNGHRRFAKGSEIVSCSVFVAAIRGRAGNVATYVGFCSRYRGNDRHQARAVKMTRLTLSDAFRASIIALRKVHSSRMGSVQCQLRSLAAGARPDHPLRRQSKNGAATSSFEIRIDGPVLGGRDIPWIGRAEGGVWLCPCNGGSGRHTAQV